MQGRLKQLGYYFVRDPATMAALLGGSPDQAAAWESGAEPVPAEVLARLEERLGVSAAWVAGGEGSMWGARLRRLQGHLAGELKELSGFTLVEMISATTGERMAYVMGLLRKAAPDWVSIELLSSWLGLSVGSVELLLRGELDPGAPIVARASDLTGIPERWFRVGPAEEMHRENEAGGF